MNMTAAISMLGIALSGVSTVISITAAVKARNARRRFERQLDEWTRSDPY